jgi:hypothetical protein
MAKPDFGFLSILILLIFCFFPVMTAFSQESISATFNYGSIAVHSRDIQPLVNDPVRGFTLNYFVPNRCGTQWRSYYNFPNYGVSYNYKSYGNPDVLGNSHSLTSFIQISFLRKRRYFDIGFKGFAGVGYFSKIYDPIENPANKAISAHMNISAETRLYSKIRFKPIFIEYGFGLNHFSNGLIKSPNLGINVFNNSFSLGYEFEQQSENIKSDKTEKPKLIRNEFWAFAAIGFKETESQGNQYIFSSLSLNYSKQITVINKLGLGFDFLNDPSLTSFASKHYNYPGEASLNHRYGINLHNEFIMGKTGLFMAYGFYLKESEYYLSRRYYKGGFKFYFHNFFAAAIIRAVPLFRADVVELGFGYRLK